METRQNALRELARHYSNDAGTPSLLHSSATDDPAPQVRQQALRLLLNLQPTPVPAEYMGLLRDRMLHDPDDGVRGTALRLVMERIDGGLAERLLEPN